MANHSGVCGMLHFSAPPNQYPKPIGVKMVGEWHIYYHDFVVAPEFRVAMNDPEYGDDRPT